MTPSSPFCSSKVVLITDAGSDIGEAAARHLASLGHQVMFGGGNMERIAALARDITRAGHSARYQELDASSRGSVRAFVVIAEACYGRIDMLVNTAGMMAGIVAVLPVVKAQGGHVIHVPIDHALQPRAVAESVGLAVNQSTDADIGAWIVRPTPPDLQA